MRTAWLVAIVVACSDRGSRPVPPTPPPVNHVATVDAAPLEPTRKLPGPCVERITWSDGGKLGTESHTYDTEGRLAQSDFDGDGDGKVTQRVRYRYPNTDHVVIEIDKKADGIVDETKEISYTNNAALWADQCADTAARCELDGHGNIRSITSEDGDRIELDYSCWPP